MKVEELVPNNADLSERLARVEKELLNPDCDKLGLDSEKWFIQVRLKNATDALDRQIVKPNWLARFAFWR